MNHLQRTFLSILFFTPLSALAHGQEVLLTFLILALSIIIFLIIIIAIKVNLKHKLILTVAYLLSSFATVLVINNLPYRDYTNEINLLIGLVPATIFYITYLALKPRPNEKIGTTKDYNKD